MPKRKKATASDELVMVKSVRGTRSRRMKFCVQRGLGVSLNSSAREPWLSWGIACQIYLSGIDLYLILPGNRGFLIYFFLQENI